jgi:hypothetical protein
VFRIREIEHCSRTILKTNKLIQDGSREHPHGSLHTREDAQRNEEQKPTNAFLLGNQHRNPKICPNTFMLAAIMRGGGLEQFAARAGSQPTHTSQTPLTRIT